jgi:hypothetical protein
MAMLYKSVPPIGPMQDAPMITAPGVPIIFAVDQPVQGPVKKGDPELVCPQEDSDSANLGAINIPIPTIGNFRFTALGATVHAKCTGAAGCIAGSTDGSFSVTPFATVQACENTFNTTGGGSVDASVTIQGSAGVDVKKGDCLFQADDVVQLGFVAFTPAAAPTIAFAGAQQQGSFVCGAARANGNFSACVGKKTAAGSRFPTVRVQANAKTSTDCMPIMPLAAPPAPGGGSGSSAGGG